MSALPCQQNSRAVNVWPPDDDVDIASECREQAERVFRRACAEVAAQQPGEIEWGQTEKRVDIGLGR